MHGTSLGGREGIKANLQVGSLREVTISVWVTHYMLVMINL